MQRVLSWPVAFGRFWYHFIIGDDWTVAAVVVVGIAVTALLSRRGITVWWLLPLAVVTMVTVRLRSS